MASQQELEASAGKHARATSWPWERYLAEIRKNPGYAYQNTEWFKAGADLEKSKTASSDSTPPPTPDSSLAQLAQNMIFCAQQSQAAYSGPYGWPVAITADPAYSAWATAEIVAQFRAQGRKVWAWGVQTQIPVDSIYALAERLGLDGVILQSETSEEYRTAITGFRGKPGITVGNPNAWTSEQRNDATVRVNGGTLAVIGECYTNLGGPWPNNYSGAGVPLCSLCLGVYDGSNEQPGRGWYPTVAAYKQNTPPSVWPSVGIYHAAGLRAEDWAALA